MQRFVQIPSKNLQFEFEPFATLKKVLPKTCFLDIIHIIKSVLLIVSYIQEI